MSAAFGKSLDTSKGTSPSRRTKFAFICANTVWLYEKPVSMGIRIDSVDGSRDFGDGVDSSHSI